MRRLRVFFYGLFMDEALLRSRGIEPRELGRATLPGFRLRIGRRATLLPDDAATVHGMAGLLSHEEIERLYSDASVRDYRPEAVVVRLGEREQVPALCFNLVEEPSPDEHDRDYAARLRALAKRLDFPDEYVASIE